VLGLRRLTRNRWHRTGGRLRVNRRSHLLLHRRRLISPEPRRGIRLIHHGSWRLRLLRQVSPRLRLLACVGPARPGRLRGGLLRRRRLSLLRGVGPGLLRRSHRLLRGVGLGLLNPGRRLLRAVGVGLPRVGL
jgi:hypothetical protein